MPSQLERRVSALERTMCPPAPIEPPAPAHDPFDYVDSGCIRFAGPCRVRSVAVFDTTGDIGRAADWLNWELHRDPFIYVLLEADQIGQALDALADGTLVVVEGWRPGDRGWPVYSKCGSYNAGALACAVGRAVAAWLEQGEAVELSHAGIMALLQSWAA